VAQPFKDYYSILGIPFEASEADIKTAYRKMARLFHPDMHPEDPTGFTEKFQEITEAHDTLSDFLKKEAYDQQYRETVLGEVPQMDYYYYIEPQGFYNTYEAYEPPQPKKRNAYIPFGGILVLLAFFIKMLLDVSSPEATNNVRGTSSTYNLQHIQYTVDSLQQADAAKHAMPQSTPFQPSEQH